MRCIMANIKRKIQKEYLESKYNNEDDNLSKKDLAERISFLYQNIDHGSVSILHGRWGSGKSTFAKKLKVHLEDDGFAVSYFDAFSNDYVESPFLALNAHFIREIEESGNSETASGKKIKTHAAKAGRHILTAGAKIGVKAITLGLVGASEIDELSKIVDDMADEAGEVTEAAAKRILENFAHGENEFSAFRTAISELPKALGGQESSSGKAIVIIDELDRCRPDFAIGVLEILKHLFDADDLHFILVTNREFLVESVRAKYGLQSHASEYLEKFYDFIVYFEEPQSGRHQHAAATLIGRQIDDLIPDTDRRDKADLKDYLQQMAFGFDMTLRQAEALATNASLAYLTFNDRVFRPTILIAVMSLYRARFPQIYESIKRRDYEVKQLLSVFDGAEFDENFAIERVKTILEYYGSKDDEIDRSDPRFAGYGQMVARYNFREYRDVLPALANSVLDRFGKY